MPFIRFFVFLLALFLPAAGFAAQTELTWYGHSAFKVKTPEGKVLLIDPWITNPANKSGKEDLEKIGKVDLILISHGHFDHVGNAVEIAKKTGAKLVTTYDLGMSLVKYAGFPKNQAGFDTLGNFGGEITVLDGEVRIAFIPAVHSSSVMSDDGKDIHMGGNPGGFLIMIKNGPSIYHTGDTDVFSDMSLIPRFHKVDVMLACIGDHFTMGPERAAMAVKLVRPKWVIPMHYGTFPVLTGTPAEFSLALKNERAKAKLRVMTIGETIEF
ncbi:MAG TPA: metal-dependent hydrolase [Burkholderiales bacterium]|nr:metal-dependent hydrolase [Burkholderiales bacterium]